MARKGIHYLGYADGWQPIRKRYDHFATATLTKDVYGGHEWQIRKEIGSDERPLYDHVVDVHGESPSCAIRPPKQIEMPQNARVLMDKRKATY